MLIYPYYPQNALESKGVFINGNDMPAASPETSISDHCGDCLVRKQGLEQMKGNLPFH